MHIGNKIFPYPVLNANLQLTGYNETSSFGFSFEKNVDKICVENGKLCFKQIRLEIANQELEKLLSSNKIAGAFVVECSRSMFRKTFPISTSAYDVRIDIEKLSGSVEVSAYLYATENIIGYQSKDFKPVFHEYAFDIEKFDIVAIDDGFHFNVDVDTNADNNVSSIFTVVGTEMQGDYIGYDLRSDQIVIQVPQKMYESYKMIKRDPNCNNIAFSMLAIPVLAECLRDLCSDADFEEAIDNNSWLKSVVTAYKRETNKDLDIDTLNSETPLKVAQIVLNYAVCKGLVDFEGILSDNRREEDGEDYE